MSSTKVPSLIFWYDTSLVETRTKFASYILARQCRAFSRALKIEKLKAPLFRGPKGAGATNDWCIILKCTIINGGWSRKIVQLSTRD